MTDTPEKNSPTKEVRVGSCNAAIWENESDGRTFFSVTFSRLYRTENGWRSTGSFGLNDLPHWRCSPTAHTRPSKTWPRTPATEPASSGSLAGPLSYGTRTTPPLSRCLSHAFTAGRFTKLDGTTTVRSHTPEPHSPPGGGEWAGSDPPPIYGSTAPRAAACNAGCLMFGVAPSPRLRRD